MLHAMKIKLMTHSNLGSRRTRVRTDAKAVWKESQDCACTTVVPSKVTLLSHGQQIGGRTDRRGGLGTHSNGNRLSSAPSIPHPYPKRFLCTTFRLLGAHAPRAPCVLLSPPPLLHGGRTSRKDPLGRLAQRQQLVQRALHTRAARRALLHIRQPPAAARRRRPGADARTP